MLSADQSAWFPIERWCRWLHRATGGFTSVESDKPDGRSSRQLKQFKSRLKRRKASLKQIKSPSPESARILCEQYQLCYAMVEPVPRGQGQEGANHAEVAPNAGTDRILFLGSRSPANQSCTATVACLWLVAPATPLVLSRSDPSANPPSTSRAHPDLQNSYCCVECCIPPPLPRSRPLSTSLDRPTTFPTPSLRARCSPTRALLRRRNARRHRGSHSLTVLSVFWS
jgi:hypothetical protein